ncbi:MAG: hypothetical protein AAF127_10630 [Pseudomonadota bacterium]
MRLFMDILDGMTGLIRLVIGAFALVILGLGLMFTYSINAVTPAAIEEITEQAREAQSEARRERLRAVREREMAKQGWGYEAAGASGNQPSDYAEQHRRTKDGWGTGQ